MLWKTGKIVFASLSILTVITALTASFCVLKPASFLGYGTCVACGSVLAVPFLCLFANGFLYCKKRLEKPMASLKIRRNKRDDISLDAI